MSSHPDVPSIGISDRPVDDLPAVQQDAAWTPDVATWLMPGPHRDTGDQAGRLTVSVPAILASAVWRREARRDEECISHD